jgi:hypothetical protein
MVFIAVPRVVVFVASVIVAPVVLVAPVFMSVFLRGGSGHHNYRSGQCGSQKE